MRSNILPLILGLCSLGAAQAQISSNVTLLGQFHNPSLPAAGDTRYNDVWGYVDCDGEEYAILGSAHYVHFFNLANPASPQLVGQFTGGATTVWRDIDTFRDRAYSVCDNCSEGLMIFDLSGLPGTVTKTNQTSQFFSRAHTIYIDKEAGRLYVAGSNTKSNGVIVLDLNGDPDHPTQIGNPSLPGGYVHDLHVRDNKGYCSHGNNGYWVYNFSSPQNPILLGTLTDYPQEGYNHSSWLSENGQHIVMADETHNKGLKMVDVSDLSDMTVTDVFRSALLGPADTASIAHNPYIRDNYLFVAYYHDGMQIFNISDPNNAVKVAWYDTYPGNVNYSGFKGCWSVYPFLPSGTILAADMTNGLFIMSLNNINLDPIPYPSYPDPDITLSGGNPICEGQSVTLHADPTATDVEWFHNGNLLPEDDNSIQVEEEGTYHAMVYNEYCGVESNSIELEVIPLPNPVITPLGNTTICQGQSVFLSVDPTATGVHWYRNGTLFQIGGILLQVQQAGTYSAILFNQICQIQTNSIVVQVIPYPSPILTLDGEPLFCEGESVTLSVTPSATMVHWFRNGSLHQVGGTQLVVEQSGSYHALVFNQNCSVQTATYNIVVLPLPFPVITPLGDPAICEGESIYLSANPTNATTVHWYRNGVLHQTGGFLLQVDEAGAYSAILFNQFCPIESNTVDIEVVPFPDPGIAVSGETSICEGESVLLSVDPAATDIDWYLDGQLLPWSEPSLSAQEEGVYFAILANQDCIVQTDPVEIELIPFPDPQILVSGGPSICEGESVTLSVDPSATSVEWYLDGLLLAGEEGLQIEVQTGGTYSAILSNQDCTIESESVEIEVIPFPDPEIVLSGESSICEGESVTLSADPSATGVEWYLDGDLLEGEEAQIEVQEGGVYYAILSNQNCTIQSESVEIALIPFPDPDIALSGEPSICEGESVTLSADPSASGVAWYLDGELLGSEEHQIEVQEGGIYYAVLSNQDCSIQTESVEILLIPSPSPEIALSGESSICEGESVTLSADPSASGIEWYLDGELLDENGTEIEAQEEGTYFAILSNQACTIQTESVEIQVIPYPSPEIVLSGESSFCEGESATLSVDAAATDIEWYLDGELLEEDQAQLEVQTGGSYYAILSNQGCIIQTGSVEIQVIPAPDPGVDLIGENSICEGESVFLLADPSATDIAWYLNGELIEGAGSQLEAQAEGTYYAILSNEVCTIQSESVEIQVIPYPNPGIAISGETSICEGESVTLDVDPTAGAITWYLNGEPLGSEESQIEVQEGGVYYAVLSNQDCSVQTESVEIQVIPAPGPEVALLGETTICEGESVTLQVDPTATGIAWYLDGELLEEEGPQLEAQEQGTYYAILSNEVCTIQTDAVEIEVIPYPSPEIALEGESSICEGESVLLSVDATAADIAWYLDGELLGWDQPQLEAQVAGAYYAILSNQGCTVQTSTVEIQVIPAPSPEVALTGETSICEGESVLLGVDDSAISIEWYLDGAPLGWDQPQLETQAGGMYYAILSNEACTIQTESIEIQVQAAPDPTLVYEGALACEGDSIPLLANGGLDSWQWYLDGVPIESATGPEFWAHSSGEYSYTGTLGPCEVGSESVSISIVEPIVPVVSFLDDTLFAPPAAVYQWYFNGELLEGATGAFLVPLESGKYTVWTLDENGCEAISEPVEVDIINSVSNRLPNGWKFYPNPTSDWLVLELTGITEGVYALYDLRGRMVLDGVLGGGRTEISLGDLGAGVYVLEIQTRENSGRVKVVVFSGR